MSDVFYIFNYDTAHIWAVNKTTGALVTDVGFVVVDGVQLNFLASFAYDAVSGKLYGETSHDDTNFSPGLIEINPATGVATYIGALGLGGTNPDEEVSDMSFSPAGVLYGWTSEGSLVTVDTDTGLGTVVGTPGGGAGWGALSFAGSTLYLISYQTGNLDTVNTSTGVRTPVSGATFGIFPDAMTYSGGVMYAWAYTDLYTVNLSTPAVTYVSTTTIGARGLARVPSPPGLAPGSAPINNTFANRITIINQSGAISGTTFLSTPDWPTGDINTDGNVWYEYTPAVNGNYSFGLTVGEAGLGITKVYSGTFPGSMTLLGEDFESIAMTAGTTYYIAVSQSLSKFDLQWSGPYVQTEGVIWRMGVYDRLGYSYASLSYDGLRYDEYLKHATDITWTVTLNGIDTLEFSLYLDDPAALTIFTKTTVIRLWRYINDVDNEIVRTPPDNKPDFVGIVTAITKSGSENKMRVTVQSPLWQLQSHFHLDNHRLVTDISTGDDGVNTGGNLNDKPWDHSALMWRLIDFINGTFRFSGGYTGILKPTTAAYTGTGYLAGDSLFWPQTIEVSPFYVEAGSYTWPLIFDDLMARDGSPDIDPEYIYEPGTKKMMYFKTAVSRGVNRTRVVASHFDYRIGRKNLEDIEEQTEVVPGTYGNFIWISGDGGPNGGIVAEYEDNDNITEYGIYMMHKNIPGIKYRDRSAIGADTLEVAVRADAPIYTIKVASGIPFYYQYHYDVGDIVRVRAQKGALIVSPGVPQRIYQVKISYSDNNVENVDVIISADFKRKNPDTI